MFSARLVELCLAALTAFLCLLPRQAAAERPLIGVSLPLSGGSASEGADLRSMLEFVNRELTNNAYELVFEDDQCSDKQGITIAHNFVQIRRVRFVVGFACSGTILAAAPVYEKARTVTIGLAVGAPAIAQAGEYIFRTSPNLDIAAAQLVGHARKRYRRIGILSEDTGYAQSLAQAFITQNADNALEVFAETYLPDTTDFRSMLAKMRAKKIDALFLNPQADTGLVAMYRQLLEMQWQIPLYGTYYPSFSLFLNAFGTRADGIVFADLPFLGDALDENGKTLYARYKQLHGVPGSSEFYFITTLAAFHALHSAVQAEKDVKDYLLSRSFSGPFGTFSFDRNGDVKGDKLTFVLKTIRGGKPVLLEEDR